MSFFSLLIVLMCEKIYYLTWLNLWWSYFYVNDLINQCWSLPHCNYKQITSFWQKYNLNSIPKFTLIVYGAAVKIALYFTFVQFFSKNDVIQLFCYAFLIWVSNTQTTVWSWTWSSQSRSKIVKSGFSRLFAGFQHVKCRCAIKSTTSQVGKSKISNAFSECYGSIFKFSIHTFKEWGFTLL